jgi:hypothetical protein
VAFNYIRTKNSIESLENLSQKIIEKSPHPRLFCSSKHFPFSCFYKAAEENFHIKSEKIRMIQNVDVKVFIASKKYKRISLYYIVKYDDVMKYYLDVFIV